MRRLVQLVVATGVVAALSFAPNAGAGPEFRNKYSSTQDVDECKDGDNVSQGTVTYTGPLKLWPPNHKYANATVVAQSADNDPATLTTEATHNQPEGDAGNNGSGNTVDDITPAAASEPSEPGEAGPTQTIPFKIRSERAGSVKEGRVYTIAYEATFGEEACTGTFTITVPHDMRNK